MNRSGNTFTLTLLTFIVICVITFIAGRNVIEGATSDKKSGRYYEPVEVPGELFGTMVGKRIDDLAVYTWDGAKWRPVLFQIDERTPDGKFVLTEGPENNTKAGNGIFDKQDLVVFMARDAGALAPKGEAPKDAETAVAIELMDTVNGDNSAVYLVSFAGGAPVNKLEPVVRLTERGGVFNFCFPTYCYDALTNKTGKKSIPTIYINKLWVLRAAGGNEQNIIDRQKIRGQITFLGGKIKIPFNEGLVNGGIVAYKTGPVRILTHSVMYPQFPMGIKGPEFYIDSTLVDTLTLTTTKVKVAFDPGYAIHDMTISIGFDLTPAAKGMKYYNSNNLKGFTIDGRMDDDEKKFNNAKDEWRLITGPQGTQITYGKFDPAFLKYGEAYSYYNDNEADKNPPENFPGDVGAAYDRITVTKLKTGTYKINVFGCVPFHFYDPKGLNTALLNDILNIQKTPLTIKVGAKKIKNLAGLQRMMDGS